MPNVNLWTSKGFKKKVVCCYARWVALDSVCGEYMLAIQEMQKDLYKYITENPTYEDAKRNVEKIKMEFQAAERDFEKWEESRSLLSES